MGALETQPHLDLGKMIVMLVVVVVVVVTVTHIPEQVLCIRPTPRLGLSYPHSRPICGDVTTCILQPGKLRHRQVT